MYSGEGGGPSAGQVGPEDLAPAILARIVGGDFPCGAALDPVRLALLFDTNADHVCEALVQLERHGATVRDGTVWHVAPTELAAGLNESGRGQMQWTAPLLRAVVAMAVSRITPGEAGKLLAAYDRQCGLAGNGSVVTRTEGYRQFFRHLAAASGSRFHMRTVDTMLQRLAPVLEQMVAHKMQLHRPAEPDDDLGRLAQAMMQQSPASAAAALEDHLILLGRYLERPTRH